MSIFNFDDYKQFIRDRVQQMPHRGRGQFRQMALKLGVNSTVISQIFSGPRNLTSEQGLVIADYLGLSELETRYFICLINIERAGSKALELFYRSDAEKLRKEGTHVKNRISNFSEISEEHKALFYSEWIYSGIRVLSSIPAYNTVDEIADYFGISRARVQRAIEFLLSTGLCIEDNGQLKVGPQSTHLDANSPYINSHRRNWRTKGLERLNNTEETDLFYSAPISISTKDREIVREEILTLISKILKRVQKSSEEELVCLNIDWFKF